MVSEVCQDSDGIISTLIRIIIVFKPLTYINYWTEHSSTGMQWPLQPQHYLPYGVRCNGFVLLFICCRNLEQSRVDSSVALSTHYLARERRYVEQQFHWLCNCLCNSRGLGVSPSADPL